MNKEQIINELLKLKDKEVIAIIDEGRARKREERGIIRGIYDRVFTIEINNVLISFISSLDIFEYSSFFLLVFINTNVEVIPIIAITASNSTNVNALFFICFTYYKNYNIKRKQLYRF